MTNEPRAMREIHEIREKLYEETKKMTPEEHTVWTHERSRALLEQYGIQLKKATPPMVKTIYYDL